MFAVGDYVVNATNGICKITETVELDLTGEQNLKPYYLLVPIGEDTAKVYVSVENAEKRIRKAISEEDALRIIDSIPEIEELKVKFEKEREARYKEVIRSCDPLRLIALMKLIYHRKAARIAQGKKCTALDERYFKTAENQLHAELAFVLGKEKKQMDDVIQQRIGRADIVL